MGGEKTSNEVCDLGRKFGPKIGIDCVKDGVSKGKKRVNIFVGGATLKRELSRKYKKKKKKLGKS